MKEIILASASPRRREILSLTGLPFKIEASPFEEDITLNLPPDKLVEHLSLGKAEAVAKNRQNAVVIGADTIVDLEGKILGKPKDLEGARQTLKLLSGRPHEVITGYTIFDTDSGKTLSKSVSTKVYFKPLSKEDIEGYLKTGELMDKAGSYAIQGLGAVLIEKIEGDYFNVMGLPLCSLIQSLKDFDINIWQ